MSSTTSTRGGSSVLMGSARRQHQGERGALAELARDHDVAAQERGQAPADRQPQPGAPRLARVEAVLLRKALERALLPPLGVADAGIGTSEKAQKRLFE